MLRSGADGLRCGYPPRRFGAEARRPRQGASALGSAAASLPYRHPRATAGREASIELGCRGRLRAEDQSRPAPESLFAIGRILTVQFVFLDEGVERAPSDVDHREPAFGRDE